MINENDDESYGHERTARAFLNIAWDACDAVIRESLENGDTEQGLATLGTFAAIYQAIAEQDADKVREACSKYLDWDETRKREKQQRECDEGECSCG